MHVSQSLDRMTRMIHGGYVGSIWGKKWRVIQLYLKGIVHKFLSNTSDLHSDGATRVIWTWAHKAMFFLVFLLWVIANYDVTSVKVAKSSFRDLLTGISIIVSFIKDADRDTSKRKKTALCFRGLVYEPTSKAGVLQTFVGCWCWIWRKTMGQDLWVGKALNGMHAGLLRIVAQNLHSPSKKN